jgi:hypothetical protein
MMMDLDVATLVCALLTLFDYGARRLTRNTL